MVVVQVRVAVVVAHVSVWRELVLVVAVGLVLAGVIAGPVRVQVVG